MPPIATDRPFREWPIEQLAEQALLHPRDRVVLSGLATEAAHRPGARAKALHARILRLIDDIPGAPPDTGAAELRAMLAAAAEEIARLRGRLAATRSTDATDEPGPHRRVYLTPNAPAWLVAEVRRAFRRRYHPDGHSDAARRHRAQEVFKRAEAVFDEIARKQ